MKLSIAGIKVGLSILGNDEYDESMINKIAYLPFVSEIDNRCTGFTVVFEFENIEQMNKELEQAKKNLLDCLNNTENYTTQCLKDGI
jgi:hypothetical protein